MALGIHRHCCPPSQAQAEQRFLMLGIFFSLLFRSWVSVLDTVVAPVLNQVPSLPSGCSWGVVCKWHKTRLVLLKSFSTELLRGSLGLETSSDSCGCPAGNCWHNYSIPGIASLPFWGESHVTWAEPASLHEKPALFELNKDKTENQLLHVPEARDVPVCFPLADRCYTGNCRM